MTVINEIDPIAPSTSDLGQRQPCGPVNVEKQSLREPQNNNGLLSNQGDLHGISSAEKSVYPSEPPKSSQDAIRRSSSSSGSSTQTPNLDNPFTLFETAEKLDEVVLYFAFRHGLMNELDFLKRAAYAERDEEEALQHPNFPMEERVAIEQEREAPFLKQSRSLRGAVLVVGTLSAMCQGWTQSVLNGSGPAIALEFHLHIRHDDPERNSKDLWIYGILAACVSLASGILSPLVADPIQNHWLGRRGAVAVSAIVSVAATIGASCSQTIPQLIGCRVLIGASLGAKASIIAPFIAELSPVHLRGSLLSSWQINVALGIFFGFLSWIVVERSTLSPEARWRILTLTGLIPTLPLLAAAYMVPESYVFLMKTRQYPKAAEAACLYRRSRIQGLRNLIASHFQMEAEGQLMRMRKETKKAEHQPRYRDEENLHSHETVTSADRDNDAVADETKPLRQRLTGEPPGICLEVDSTSTEAEVGRQARTVECSHLYHMKEIHFFKRLWQVFVDARCRRALLSSGMAMMAQSLCGINVFAFFSSLFLNADISSSASLALGISFGSVNFAFGLITPVLSDRLGRTTLLLLGLPVMAVLAFILASVFELQNSARTPTILIFTLLFTAIYSFTVGPAAYSLAAESFPSSVREAGMAICVFINTTSLGVLLLIYPFVTAPIGYTVSLCIFGAIDVLAFVGCFLLCVDTKDRTLDELQFSFDLPSSLHCRYRLLYVFPEAWKHYTELVYEWICRFWKKGEGARTKQAMIPNDVSNAQWGLIPFHRWARIQKLDRHFGARTASGSSQNISIACMGHKNVANS